MERFDLPGVRRSTVGFDDDRLMRSGDSVACGTCCDSLKNMISLRWRATHAALILFARHTSGQVCKKVFCIITKHFANTTKNQPFRFAQYLSSNRESQA